MNTPATTVNVKTIDEPDELYCHYERQTNPQDVVLALDLEDGELTCYYTPEIGCSRPASVYHGRTLWATIPPLTAAAANQLLADVKHLAQTVLEGATIEWNGHNRVGSLNDAAAKAWEQIEERCAPEQFDETDQVSEYSAGDWFADEGRPNTINRLGLTAATTDAQLDELAAAEVDNAASLSGLCGYVVLTGVREWLQEAREDLRDAKRTELAELAHQIAEQIADLISRRDAAVVEQYGWGDRQQDSTRKLGIRIGRPHATVQRILAKAGLVDTAAVPGGDEGE